MPVLAKLPYTVAFADPMHLDGVELARELFEKVIVWDDPDYKRWIHEADGICNRAKVIPSADLRAAKKVRVLSKQGVGGMFLLLFALPLRLPPLIPDWGAPECL